jgi:hypothetical protein
MIRDAVNARDGDLIVYLLNNGADANERDDNGVTAPLQ